MHEKNNTCIDIYPCNCSRITPKIQINPLNPSDQHLTSPYSHTAKSFIKITRIKEMISKSKCMEKCMEKMDTDVMV